MNLHIVRFSRSLERRVSMIDRKNCRKTFYVEKMFAEPLSQEFLWGATSVFTQTQLSNSDLSRSQLCTECETLPLRLFPILEESVSAFLAIGISRKHDSGGKHWVRLLRDDISIEWNIVQQHASESMRSSRGTSGRLPQLSNLRLRTDSNIAERTFKLWSVGRKHQVALREIGVHEEISGILFPLRVWSKPMRYLLDRGRACRIRRLQCRAAQPKPLLILFRRHPKDGEACS